LYILRIDRLLDRKEPAIDAATAIASILLAAAITYAAARKLSHRPEVVAEYARAGVPEERLGALAAILLAAAVGLVGGLVWGPLGTAAAAGLAIYFAVAVGFHARAGDLGNVATPVALCLLAIAVVALGLAA
jgi:DoxX-like family